MVVVIGRVNHTVKCNIYILIAIVLVTSVTVFVIVLSVQLKTTAGAEALVKPNVVLHSQMVVTNPGGQVLHFRVKDIVQHPWVVSLAMLVSIESHSVPVPKDIGIPVMSVIVVSPCQKRQMI